MNALKKEKIRKHSNIIIKYFFLHFGTLTKHHIFQALLNLNGLVGLSNDETKQVNNLKVLVNNNMAAVYIKNGNLPKALNASNIVKDKGLFSQKKKKLIIGNRYYKLNQKM